MTEPDSRRKGEFENRATLLSVGRKITVGRRRAILFQGGVAHAAASDGWAVWTTGHWSAYCPNQPQLPASPSMPAAAFSNRLPGIAAGCY